MPVTAKLSKRFYDRLGDEIANELADWFNQVDATYKSDLRELNELNFARIDAKLEQRLSELRGELIVAMERGFREQTRFVFGAWAALLVAIVGLWFRR
jgi:hypothetical protein